LVKTAWSTLLLFVVLSFACDAPSNEATPTVGLSSATPEVVTPAPAQPVATPAPTQVAIANLPIFDMHFHPDTAWDLPSLIALMDELGVAKAVGGSGGTGSTALDFAERYPDRFVPFAGQDVLRALHASEGTAVSNFESPRVVQHVAALEQGLLARCWAGIGELFVNTIASHRTGAFRMPADSNLMRRLWETSATYDVPLSVHMDADPASVAELRRLLALNPAGTWIWAHSGWYAEPALLRELLQAHPNLYLELSFRDEPRSFAAVSSGGRLREDWRSLLEEMPERFVLGTDLLPPPTAAKYGDLIRFWRGILEQLTPATAAKLAHDNAARLLSEGRAVDIQACSAAIGR
jgi:predicted TIM-barrel fold metal-dependent hydrolase